MMIRSGKELQIESNRNDVDIGRWMWHGGAIGTSDTNDSGALAIYCVSRVMLGVCLKCILVERRQIE